MNKSNPPDYVFITLAGILVLFGLMMLASATTPYAYARFGDSYYFLKKQVLYGFLPGLFLFFLLSKINYRFWKKSALPIFIISIGLLILVFIPGLGSNYGTQAQSWIKLGSFSIQPSEVVKLSFLFFLAAWL